MNGVILSDNGMIFTTHNTAKLLTDVNGEIIVSDYKLYQNYPNPFNPTTRLSFSIPKKENVTLEIFNSLGQKVETLLNNVEYSSGIHHINWNANLFGIGVYIYRLKAGNRILSKKMMLMK